MTAENDLIELEIAAFMGPHIKRARIVLAALGVLNFVWGWIHYSDVAEAKRFLDAIGSHVAHDADFDRVQRLVTLAYVLVVGWVVGGVADVVLAIVAGKKTIPAFYAAAAIFIALTALEFYVAGANMFLSLTSVLWWLSVIALAMGFTAARKAEQLRARSAPAVA